MTEPGWRPASPGAPGGPAGPLWFQLTCTSFLRQVCRASVSISRSTRSSSASCLSFTQFRNGRTGYQPSHPTEPCALTSGGQVSSRRDGLSSGLTPKYWGTVDTTRRALLSRYRFSRHDTSHELAETTRRGPRQDDGLHRGRCRRSDRVATRQSHLVLPVAERAATRP